MFEAYKVATTLTITNHMSSVLAVIASDLGKTDAKIKGLIGSLRGLKAAQMGLAGALIGGVGYAGIKAVQGLVKPATEYVHQIELAKAAMKNLEPARAQLELAEMTAAAWKTTSEVMTTTPAENIKALRELKPVLGDLHHAIAILPQVQKVDAILKSYLHGEGGIGAKDVAFTAVKALELKGVMDQKSFTEQLDLLTAGVIATGGKVTPQQVHQAVKYGGIGITRYTNDFTYGILPSLIQENGGSSTANALTSMFRAVVGGRVDKKALPIWESLGLLDEVKGVTGESAMVQAKNAKLYQASPFKYAQWLDEQLIAKGYTNPEDRQMIIDRLFSNRNAGKAANTMMMQGPRLEKDFNLIQQAGSTSVYGDLAKNDPVTAWDALGKQWTTFETALGKTIVPIIMPALRGMTSALNTLGTFLEQHPTIATALTGTFTALSGLAAIGGGLLIAGAALKLMVVPFGGLAALDLGAMATGLGGVAAAFVRLAGPVAAVATAAYYAGDASQWLFKKGQEGGHWLNRKLGRESAGGASGSWAPPAGNDNSVIIQHTTNLDGRPIYQSTSRHMANEGSRPPTGPSGFDGRSMPMWGGL